MNTLSSDRLNEPVRGWLHHLWRKSMTPDTWTTAGNPHPWWDQYSEAPMLSFPRFDLSESSYSLLLMGRRTPAWREVYTQILEELIRRHTTFWAAVDWLTQIGPDPDRKNYPFRYRALIPRDLWGEYDVPGWTANGVEPWGLQPDPIGSDGFLFFRGWFNLLLGIHRAVSGEKTWERPFEMAGVGDRTFPWTHTGITQFLGDQWRRVPEGPHCENTKIWPTCLSAAGLGLQLTDLTTGTRTHDVVDQWSEDFLKKKYMKIDGKNDVRWVANYYDPQLDRVMGKSRLVGVGPAFYLLSQNRPLAESIYRAGVASVGWDKPGLPVIGLPGAPRAMSVALLMAREFGDHTTERRLARKSEKLGRGRYFDGSEGSLRSNGRSRPAPGGGGDEFGYFFNFKEPWPRPGGAISPQRGLVVRSLHIGGSERAA